MLREALILGAALVAIMSLACGPGQVDQVEDFTEEVEAMCASYCELNLACHEPPWFESHEECEQVCLHLAYIYNDTTCGDATRAVTACVASQPTCELYNDTNNVHADDYTCKPEKDHWAEVSAYCGQSGEQPFPMGEP